MPRKAKPTPKLEVNYDELDQDTVDTLKNNVKEFIRRYDNIESEIKGLQESRKDLVDEFSDRLDMKTMKAAIKTIKTESTVPYKTNYEAYCEILRDDEVNGLVN